MTQHPNPSVRSIQSRKALLRRIGCLGSLSIFSGGMAFAQAPSPAVSPSPVVVPTEAVSPAPVQPSPAAPEKLAPEPAPVVTETPKQAPVAAESPAPKPQVPAVASPTPNYEAPDAVIFSDRKSGCEFSVNNGQVSNCGKAPTAAVNPKTTGIRNAVSKVISSVIRPNFATDNNDAESAEVGSLNQGAGSSNWTPSTVTPPSLFVQNYFNRTIRPLGLPGNGDVRLLFPLSIPSVISSVFGWRIHPITGDQRLHTGTDLAAPMGTPVLAALTGRVIMSDFFGGYGLSVALEHSNGTQQTLYAHLSEVFVRPGDIVTQGTTIGRVGSTGASTGPHLHFEFRQQAQDGTWVAQDPGMALETALAQLVNAVQVSQNSQQKAPTQKARS
mgnify:CR=1 FL=1